MQAVIMAGGKGMRMHPLTKKVPKPMLPIGNKPIMEAVIEKLAREGFSHVIITTGYIGDMIRDYFKDGDSFGVKISYTEETKPLGTIGALTLIKDKPNEPFLVINGDILTDQNLAEFLDFHIKNHALVTVGIAEYAEKIRYGVIKRDGELLYEIEEKPKVYFEIGAGIYAISPEIINIIPHDCFFNFPDLLPLLTDKSRIKCYTIKGFWRDIGCPGDYEEVNKDTKLLSSLGCSIENEKDPKSSIIKISIADSTLSYEEAKACFDVVLSGWVHEGEKVKDFEDSICQYVGCKHAIAFFNGTVALHSLLIALGIGNGDEVIVPSLTFISSATSVLHAGAEVVFADIDEETFNLDPADVEKRITTKTKAIIVVHYAGQSANIDGFKMLCRRKNLFLIEDAAEAIGAEYNGRKVGAEGGIGAMFSFTPTKNITVGEGGMIATNDDEIEKKLRLLKNHGSPKEYYHEMIGYNYRMTEMQGAIGVEQMKKLPEILAKKRTLANYFAMQLAKIRGIVPPSETNLCKHSYMMFTIRVGSDFSLSRDELKDELNKKGIQSKVYFPLIHKQNIFRDRYGEISLPVSERIGGQILSLPIHSKLSKTDIDFIIDTIQNAGVK
jgi:perosamine synthetase